MYIFDTNELPAVLRADATHCKHLKKRDMSKLDYFFDSLGKVCRGNFNINLQVTGGKVKYFEPSAKVAADDDPKKTA